MTYAHWNGAFDYNAHPLAPPGCKTVVHETLNQLVTWDEKGTLAWYLGPSMDHYRCHDVYVPKTRSEKVAKSVKFFPQNCPAPVANPRDDATRAALLLAEALQRSDNTYPHSAPSQEQMKALTELSKIFVTLTRHTTPNEKAVMPKV